MKRFSRFIAEVKEPKEYRRLEGSGTGSGEGPSFKNLTGVDLPSDEIIAAGIAGEAQKMASGGLNKSSISQQPVATSAKKVGDTSSDITKGVSDIAQKGADILKAGIKKVEPHVLSLDIRRPAVKNQLYDVPYGGPSFKQGSTEKSYNMRGVSNPKEIEDIKRTGYVKPRSDARSGDAGKDTKYWVHTDKPEHMPHHGQAGTIRVPSGKTPVGRAVKAKDVESYNTSTGKWEPLMGPKKTK